MSLANSDSGEMFESAEFGSEEFDSGFDSGIDSGFDSGMELDGADGGFIGQTSDEVAMGGAVMPPRPVKQKGFTLDSFLILISMLLMLTSAIILFSYLGKIEV